MLLKALMRIPMVTVKSMVKNVKVVAVLAALHVMFEQRVNVVRKKRSKLTTQKPKLSSLANLHHKSQRLTLK